jgi:hypothetical protein
VQDELDRQHIGEIDKYNRLEHQRIAWQTQNQAWEMYGQNDRSDSELHCCKAAYLIAWRVLKLVVVLRLGLTAR